jgi:hypothetical protein
MDFGTILNIIIAGLLFLVALRDIILNVTEKDFSQKKYPPIVRLLFSSKEQVVAKKFLLALGFSSCEDFKKQLTGGKLYNYKGAITFISDCIEPSKSSTNYKFGNDPRKKHTSSFYVDSMSFAQKKDKCEDLYKLMKHLIHRVDRDYQYVFSIKGGNIPLAVAFSKDNFSIMPKDQNEQIDTGSDSDSSFINYEGLRYLDEYAKRSEGKEIKGIAVTCNLTTGTTFLKAIETYNKTIEKLQKNGEVAKNIKRIENVYILYKVIDSNDLDINYASVGLKCYRYFDLNEEESKPCLLSIKEGKKDIDDFPCYKCIKGKKPNKCKAQNCYKLIP